MNDGPAGGFTADVDALARHAARFDTLAERVGEIDAALRGAIEPLEGVWGADDVGRSFAEGHQPGAQQARSGLAALPERLAGMGGRLGATAEQYRAVDEDAAARLRRDES